MERHNAEDFRAATSFMRTVCPPPKGFGIDFKRVEPEQLGDGRADCTRVKNKFIIRISKETTIDEMHDLLCHEVAHMYDWGTDKVHVGNSGPHGPTFGVWWALVYSRFYQVA